MPSKTTAKKKPSAQPRDAKPARQPAPEPPKPVLSIEERTALLETRLTKAEASFQEQYRENLDMSWIYHDSALEGVVYTFQELRTAVDPTAQVVADSSLQPACEEIRRHREALHFIRDYAPKKRQPITVDLVKKIYLILHPEEGDLKTVKYRKDIPQHRLYFHEYAPPDKITYKVRAIIEWVNDPETRRTRSPIRLAARAHYDLLRVFPFATDSGKVARLFMNLLLLRSGYPPAIVHSTERQRYYDALKGSSAAMTQIVQESIDNNLASVEKLLETHESLVAQGLK
ncbi:MAG: Fic family protein [Polyangiaceae bacterium]|jgi:Fic family protein